MATAIPLLSPVWYETDVTKMQEVTQYHELLCMLLGLLHFPTTFVG